MQPQNMAHCHTEYVKLKESVKLHVQKGISDLPLKQVTRPSPETGHKTFIHVRGPFLYPEEVTLSLKTKGHGDESE